MSATFYHSNIDQTLSLLSSQSIAFFFLSAKFWLGAHYCAPLETLSTKSLAIPNSSPRGITVRQSNKRDSFLVLMSLSVGGLCLMPLRNHFFRVVLGKVGVRSMFWAFVFLAVVLILAYLTNPSENSFRSYLTEQSFRQHLSRLDEANEDDHSTSADSRPLSPPSPRVSNANDNISPFHFANRASISLRTPKHIFHSFGIFTIAAMVPLTKSNNNASDRSIYRDGSMISDSWFIGAFGRWWRGGIIEAWYQDVAARSKDEESWNSGILAMKALDKFHECNGLPFTTNPSGPARGLSPRSRNRERSSPGLGVLPVRSSTPPPLPKSASLPLHATRLPPSIPDHRHAPNTTPQTTPSLPIASEQTRLGTPVPSRSPSAIFDQSPAIAEVLRQISISTSTVHDLREQLTDFQATASQSHAALQGEVGSYRDRKRQEDASRLELKSRTKALEDSKRTAESVKLKAERKLKAAQNAASDANRRMDYLDQQISQLQRTLVEGEAAVIKARDDASIVEQELSEALERKKQEIKDAEDFIATLNARVRELEEKLVSEKDRLQLARERAEIHKQDQSFNHLHVDAEPISLPSISCNPSDTTTRQQFTESPEPFVSSDTDVNGCLSSVKEPTTSPRVAKLSLGGISSFNSGSSDKTHMALRSKGYSIFDDDIASLTHVATFSPFGENNVIDRTGGRLPTSLSPSLIPTNVISPLSSAEPLTRHLHSDNDPFVDGERRGVRLLPQASGSPLTTSPISTQDNSSNEYDPFEVRVPATHDRLHSESFLDRQRFTILHRTHSDPNPQEYEQAESINVNKAGPRRWFSTREKPRKGLNPDAKVFSLSRKAPIGSNSGKPLPYDALNPNGVSPNVIPSASSSAFLHAFAPSPAEREVLQRALGGSTNASLERLPSLSDVSSIPSSPSHIPAVAVALPMPEVGKVLPSWLQALPRIRKPNFSPWDDDEMVESVGNGVQSKR